MILPRAAQGSKNRRACWQWQVQELLAKPWKHQLASVETSSKRLCLFESRQNCYWRINEKHCYTCLKLLTSCCWSASPPLRAQTLLIRNRVTGKFCTSCLHTSHVLFPFMLNHFIAHSLWAKASSPLQLHSILKVSPPSLSSTRQILQTASSSGISSASFSVPE